MTASLPDLLLQYLQGRLGEQVTFDLPPTRLSGGFDTTTLEFSLRDAPPAYRGALVLRWLPEEGRGQRRASQVRREAATHAALVGQGFPAPRVLAAEPDGATLGGPFLIMERLTGNNMWANVTGPNGSLARLPRVSRQLADVHRLLHRVPGEVLLASARDHGLDTTIFTVGGEIRRLAARAERAGLDGLAAGFDWLERNRPAPAMPEALCHGDFHPLNIVMDGDRLSGVVDWSQAISAEPAFDLAATRVILLHASAGEPRWLRWPVALARRLPVARYLRFYRAGSPLEMRNMPYFECLRMMGALVFAGDGPPPEMNPWHKPHVLAPLYRRIARISGVRVRL